jgi:pimeloyl-ACP methyl ester carboxylesterase
VINRRYNPADFCFINPDPNFRLTPLERLTLTGGPELERALQRMAKQFDNFVEDSPLVKADLDQLQEALAFYAVSGWLSEPRRAFVMPVTPPYYAVTPVHGLPDGVIEDLQFRTQHQSHLPILRDLKQKAPENETVHVRLWRHHRKARSTMIAVHGWTMGDQRVNSLAFLPGVFYRLGMDVALIELPFHGRRRPKEALSLDPLVTTDAVLQSISDLRALGLYLRSIGNQNYGVVGMSLGGYLSALWATLDILDFCVPIVPLVSLAEVEWSLLKRRPAFEELNKQGLTHDLLEHIYSFHSPLALPVQMEKERLLLIAGIGDQVVPESQPQRLWEHWGKPDIYWLGGGHMTQFQRSEAFQAINRFLQRLGFAQKRFSRRKALQKHPA